MLGVRGWLDKDAPQRAVQTYVHADVGPIHAPGNDLAVVDKDAPHGCFVRFERKFGLYFQSQHESVICI